VTLSDLASLGSFVSGVAVLVSLVFLFFQMRQISQQVRQTEQQLKQTERHQQAAVRQARTAISTDLNFRVAESGQVELLRRMTIGETPASLAELDKFLHLYIAFFQLYEEQFDQHRQGLLNDAAFKSLRQAIVNDMQWPGRRAAWNFFRRLFGDTAFIAFVDGVVAETPPSAPGQYVSLAQWNSLVAEEAAKGPGNGVANPIGAPEEA
jgi:hypothetical protein